MRGSLLLVLPGLLVLGGCPHDYDPKVGMRMKKELVAAMPHDNPLRVQCGLQPIDKTWSPPDCDSEFGCSLWRKDQLVKKQVGTLGHDARLGGGETDTWSLVWRSGDEFEITFQYSLTAADRDHVTFRLESDASGMFKRKFPEYPDGVLLSKDQVAKANVRLQAYANRVQRFMGH